MDLLLINSPLFDDERSFPRASLPPIGLGYLATALATDGFSVSLMDAVALGLGTSRIMAEIRRIQPTWVGLNVFSTNLALVRKIVSSPLSATVLLGGPAVHTLVDEISRWHSPNPLIIVAGEAEIALPALLKGGLQAMPLLGDEHNRLLMTRESDPWFPLDIDLPLDRSFFKNEPAFETCHGLFEAHMISSRGCGYDCAFCAAARSTALTRKIRFRSPEHLSRELGEIRADYPQVGLIRILDDLFLRNPTAIARAQQMFAGHSLHWRAMAHVDGLRRVGSSGYQDLRSSGCLELFVGIESGSPRLRSRIKKVGDVDSSLKVVLGLLDAGIAVKAYFVYGFPGETRMDMEQTFTLAQRMADHATPSTGQFRTSVFAFRPYHGTQLHTQLHEASLDGNGMREEAALHTDSNRDAFNFSAGNFSAVSDQELRWYIQQTQGLGK